MLKTKQKTTTTNFNDQGDLIKNEVECLERNL